MPYTPDPRSQSEQEAFEDAMFDAISGQHEKLQDMGEDSTSKYVLPDQRIATLVDVFPRISGRTRSFGVSSLPPNLPVKSDDSPTQSTGTLPESEAPSDFLEMALLRASSGLDLPISGGMPTDATSQEAAGSVQLDPFVYADIKAGIVKLPRAIADEFFDHNQDLLPAVVPNPPVDEA